MNFACGQRGLPYVWGGDGPDNSDRGFDCSGSTKSAYGAAGIFLPRTADAQYRTGNRVPDGKAILSGDLVFLRPALENQTCRSLHRKRKEAERSNLRSTCANRQLPLSERPICGRHPAQQLVLIRLFDGA
ncbi:C40 family peptidase [Kibdelosporangium lantanae]|uniref:C40 family peptidase n=1 Tax=Kibdelosporangium lantanae TaxID=1497396 RepID=A0ABW3MFY2_9PSEU